MVRRTLMAAVVIGMFASPLWAQNDLMTSCDLLDLPHHTDDQNVTDNVTPYYRQLCRQVGVAMGSVQPGIGVAFSGGNPVLGMGGTLGRRLVMPRVSATARVNFALPEVADVFDTDGLGRVAGESMPAAENLRIPVASLQGDLAVGVFNGFSPVPLLSGLGSVDLLASVAFVPRVEDVGLTSAITNIGGGVRVGIMRQGFVAPGISVSGLYRRMGEVSFGEVNASDPESGDPASFAVDLRTVSMRAVASKNLLVLNLAAGVGYDRYSSDVDLAWVLVCETQQCRNAAGGDDPLYFPGDLSGRLSTTAWNVFVSGGLNLLVLNVVAEVGLQNANVLTNGVGSVTADDIGKNTLFGSVGLRLSL